MTLRTRLGVHALEAREVPSAVFESAVAIGSADGYITPLDTAADAAGNTYVTGYFGGTMDFDPLTERADGSDVLTPRGNSDVYVAKYAPDNSLVWARRMGSDYVYTTGTTIQSEWGYRLAVDGAGSVYVSGSVAGAADFGPFTLANAGQSDAFAVKLDAAGTFKWANRWGGANKEYGVGITTDAGGNVYQVGFSTNTYTNGWVANGAVIKKYSPTGAAVWTKELPSYGGTADGVATDAAGNVLVGGQFSGTVDFNPDPRKSAYVTGASRVASGEGQNGYVLKLTGAGAFAWVAPFVAKTGEVAESGVSASDLAVDAAGNVLVGGYYRGANDFNPSSRVDLRLPYTPNATGTPVSDAFVAKLSAAGALTWATPLVGHGYRAMAVDAAGSVYVTGTTWTPYTTPTGTSSWQAAAAVTKLTTAGGVAWTATLGTGTYAYGIAVDGSGKLHVSGTFTGTVDLDPGEGDSATTHAGGNRTGMFLLTLGQN